MGAGDRRQRREGRRVADCRRGRPRQRSTWVSPAPVTCVLMSAPIPPSLATAPSANRKNGAVRGEDRARIAGAQAGALEGRGQAVHLRVVGPVA